MKKYRLKKDLPTSKAGDIFTLSENGNLYKDIDEPVPICAFVEQPVEKFPNFLTNWFEEIPDEPKTVYDLKAGDKYYTIFFEKCGDIVEKTWNDNQTDYSLRSFGLCFLTPEEAEKEAVRWRARTILERDTKDFKLTRDTSRFYFVCYDPYLGTFVVDWWNADGPYGSLTSPIIFATKEDAEDSIKAHPKEWKTYLGVEEM